MAVLRPSTRVGDFVIESLLGRGAMGEVYRATQVRLARPVALKVLASHLGDDETVARRFVREATIMRDLEHPAIVSVYDAGADDGRLYLAMRLMETATLRDLLAQGPLSADRTLDLLRPLGDALDHAHGRGVVHRDIKPANVLFDAAGRPYLADFGIARTLESASVTLSGQALGTPLYMPPEQAAGRVGHRGDLYAFACVAFEMLTGGPPFLLDEPMALLYTHAHQAPPAATERRPELPTAVDAVFRRALAKQPVERFGSATEFTDALRGALALDGSATVPAVRTLVDASARPEQARSSGFRTWWVAAAVVLALAIGSLAFTRERSDPAFTPTADPSAASQPRSSGLESATASQPGSSGPQPSSAPSPPSGGPPPEVPVAHGALLFEPSFDGSGLGFLDSPGVALDADTGVIRHSPGALELEAKTHGAHVYVQLDAGEPDLSTYVADMQLAVRPGSAVQQCWSLRWAVPGELAWYWCLDTAAEQAEFRRFDGSTMTPIGDAAPVEDLQTGRTVQVTVEVAAERLTMYLDGREVTDVVDDSVPANDTRPGLELLSKRGVGLVRVTGLRIWSLPDSSVEFESPTGS